jgi:hypothetical protein
VARGDGAASCETERCVAPVARELQGCDVYSTLTEETSCMEMPECGLPAECCNYFLRGTRRVSAHASLDAGDGPYSFACISIRRMNFLKTG